jgi:hypothetical protein
MKILISPCVSVSIYVYDYNVFVLVIEGLQEWVDVVMTSS